MSYNFRTVVGDWSWMEDRQSLEEVGVGEELGGIVKNVITGIQERYAMQEGKYTREICK